MLKHVFSGGKEKRLGPWASAALPGVKAELNLVRNTTGSAEKKVHKLCNHKGHSGGCTKSTGQDTEPRSPHLCKQDI